ncbi:MAG: amino acid decarboxylase [Acidobacteria bacterium]|nr:amino acid decarboxylase [Acidobacteriota bacterium]
MATNPGSMADMSPEELRRALGLAAEWVAGYRARVGSLPVLARVRPGDVTAALPAEPPASGDAVEAWLADLERVVLPAVTHWNHPGFMAYFGITGSGPGIVGELIAAALNVNGMLWKTCPALTEVEQVVLRWYARALGLPAAWFGMLTDTASTSTLVALAAAREATGIGVRDEGLAGKPPLVLYCSQEAHSSVEKAGIVLGLGRSGVRRIASDEKFRLRVDLLEQAIVADGAAGRRPFAVVATVGTTSATAVDPVSAIADLCARHGLWLHVDAAYAGSAAVAEEFRWALAGCERADSLVANPHKWLFAPIDCSALFTARPEAFRAALTLVPEYLKTDVVDAVDLMDYSFQLGRRFRALKLWFVFRHFGTTGLAARIREHVRLARRFAERVDAHTQLERMAEVPFSVVCFRARPAGLADEAELERLNVALLERVNATGEIYLSHTKLHGRYCLRAAIGNLGTDEGWVDRAFEVVARAAADAG